MCKVKCAGASTTAKLALGGRRHGESDPAVILANPPLQELLYKVWDEPHARQKFVRSWYMARDEMENSVGRRAGHPSADQSAQHLPICAAIRRNGGGPSPLHCLTTTWIYWSPRRALL